MWYINSDGLGCRGVLSGAGYRDLISDWCCDCLDAGIHYVVKCRKHNVKRDLGASDAGSNECVAILVHIAYPRHSLREYFCFWRMAEKLGDDARGHVL